MINYIHNHQTLFGSATGGILAIISLPTDTVLMSGVKVALIGTVTGFLATKILKFTWDRLVTKLLKFVWERLFGKQKEE